MILLEKTKVTGWEECIRGMRNPKNSWALSDTIYLRREHCDNPGEIALADMCGGIAPIIGPKDLSLMLNLVKAGTDHRKFLRYIKVSVDITAPLYWWKEFDTYKVGTTSNSCSTMHKIAEKEFTIDDFSHDRLISELTGEPEDAFMEFESTGTKLYAQNLLELTVNVLNHYRKLYLATNDKKYWHQLIQLLPSSYNQKRTIELNYEVLANMFKKTSRRFHKLPEWNVNFYGSLCHWITELPYSDLITYTAPTVSETLDELLGEISDKLVFLSNDGSGKYLVNADELRDTIQALKKSIGGN